MLSKCTIMALPAVCLSSLNVWNGVVLGVCDQMKVRFYYWSVHALVFVLLVSDAV